MLLSFSSCERCHCLRACTSNSIPQLDGHGDERENPHVQAVVASHIHVPHMPCQLLQEAYLNVGDPGDAEEHQRDACNGTLQLKGLLSSPLLHGGNGITVITQTQTCVLAGARSRMLFRTYDDQAQRHSNDCKLTPLQ